MQTNFQPSHLCKSIDLTDSHFYFEVGILFLSVSNCLLLSSPFKNKIKKKSYLFSRNSFEITVVRNGSFCIHALNVLSNMAPYCLFLSNYESYFQTKAKLNETTFKTIQLSWTMLFSQPSLDFNSKSAKTNNLTPHLSMQTCYDESNRFPVDDGHL